MIYVLWACVIVGAGRWGKAQGWAQEDEDYTHRLWGACTRDWQKGFSPCKPPSHTYSMPEREIMGSLRWRHTGCSPYSWTSLTQKMTSSHEVLVGNMCSCITRFQGTCAHAWQDFSPITHPAHARDLMACMRRTLRRATGRKQNVHLHFLVCFLLWNRLPCPSLGTCRTFHFAETFLPHISQTSKVHI